MATFLVLGVLGLVAGAVGQATNVYQRGGDEVLLALLALVVVAQSAVASLVLVPRAPWAERGAGIDRRAYRLLRFVASGLVNLWPLGLAFSGWGRSATTLTTLGLGFIGLSVLLSRIAGPRWLGIGQVLYVALSLPPGLLPSGVNLFLPGRMAPWLTSLEMVIAGIGAVVYATFRCLDPCSLPRALGRLSRHRRLRLHRD